MMIALMLGWGMYETSPTGRNSGMPHMYHSLSLQLTSIKLLWEDVNSAHVREEGETLYMYMVVIKV